MTESYWDKENVKISQWIACL